MTKHSKHALGVLVLAVVLLVVHEVFPMAHAWAHIGRMTVLGLVIIVLLVIALGIVVAGRLKGKA
jgi:hypothetical protein